MSKATKEGEGERAKKTESRNLQLVKRVKETNEALSNGPQSDPKGFNRSGSVPIGPDRGPSRPDRAVQAFIGLIGRAEVEGHVRGGGGRGVKGGVTNVTHGAIKSRSLSKHSN